MAKQTYDDKFSMGYYTDKDAERTVNALPPGWVGALPT